MILLISIYRIIKMSLISLWRNRWLSLAASFIMLLTLFTIAVFSSLLVINGKLTSSLRDKVDISVYFNDTTTKDQIFAIQNTLLGRSDIKKVDYISKEDALQRWRDQNTSNDKVRDLISESYNPLPRSLEIKAERPEDLEGINDFLSTNDYKPMIKEISYRKNKELVDRLVKITNLVKTIGWILSTIFVVISILIIFNTISLTIFARHDEVEIMKLVGASDWYIQGPFFVEGFSYGLISSIISSIVLYFSFRLSMPSIQAYLDLNSSWNVGVNFWLITSIQVLIGLTLGGLCSLIAVRKHLKNQ